MMRSVVAFLALALLAAPVATHAQPKPLHRIGFVGPGSAAVSTAVVEAFRQGLREQGYVDGQNIVIEWHFAEGSLERLAKFAADLGAGKTTVVVTPDNQAARSLRIATPPIPIILAGADLRWGLIDNLAHPGGNISGLSSMASELEPKRMELLKEAVPGVSRVLALRDLTLFPRAGDEVVFRGQRWGFALVGIPVRGLEDLDRAFATAVRERVGAISVTNTPLFATHRKRIAERAIRHRLAWVAEGRDYAEAGSLMSYGADPVDLVRRSAGYVDKILKGAKPADLPVEQPRKFELVINLKTAKALGVTIPPSVLARADEIIQ
jgi:ABC-type uncharacterized transport system substrate-binding protein